MNKIIENDHDTPPKNTYDARKDRMCAGKIYENAYDPEKETIEIERRTLDNKVDKHTIAVGKNSVHKNDVEDTEPL